MVKIVPIEADDTPVYTDIEYVEGLLDDRKIQKALYKHWERYFELHGSSEFFRIGENRKNIVHNSFKVLWNKVRTGMIYVEDGVLKGNDGKPFKGSLTTYMMSVAKLYNKELVRENRAMLLVDDLSPRYFSDSISYSCSQQEVSAEYSDTPFVENHFDEVYAIVSDIIANMSERCNQIITMYYCEGKKLDVIMEKLSSFNSKDALKTAKNKCLRKLRAAARELCSGHIR